MAAIGQEEDFKAAREKALKIGAKECYIEDLNDEFVKELCFPAIQCNAIYENTYLLGTSLARPVIARALVAVAQKEKCQFLSHGATAKGNDGIRFELAFYALQPDIQVIAPWRIPRFYEMLKGRNDLLDYAAKYSRHIYQIEAVVDGRESCALAQLARKHGVGRIDIVETRATGLKSRGCYETPGLTILRNAHIDLEGLTLDREVRALRDQFVTINYSKILYCGLYFSPEREFLEVSIKESQKTVNGQVRLRLYKGNCIVLGRSSKTEKLYDASESSMDEIGAFEPFETGGFIKVQAIRLKKYGQMKSEKNERL
jgi:argininosuccinate synthase